MKANGDQVALTTGAAIGLGRATAGRLRRLGLILALTDTAEEQLRTTEQGLALGTASAVPVISAKARFYTLVPARRRLTEPIRANKLERN
jgi:NAD(P)-dependent dehydrogenase (short-subunit alcohol dehydrogenase family)